MQVFLNGYYAFGNLGDEALLWTLLRAIDRADGGSRFVIPAPADIAPPELRARVESTSLFARDLVAAARRAQVTVFGGGSQFQDHGLWSYARHLAKHLVVRMAAGRVGGIGLSLGPLKTPIGLLITAATLRGMRPLLVRDAQSVALGRRLGASARLSEDVVFSGYLKVPSTKLANAEARIALSLLPYRAQMQSGNDSDWLEPLAQQLGSFTARRSAVHWVQAPFQRGADEAVLARAVMNVEPTRQAALSFLAGPDDALMQLSQCSHFVAMRFHALVYAALLGRPVLILPYHPKVRLLARSLGYPSRALLDIEDVTRGGTLASRLEAMLDAPHEFLPTVSVDEVMGATRVALDAAVGELLDLVRP